MTLLQNAVQGIPFPQASVQPEYSFNSFLTKRDIRLFPKGPKQLEKDGIIQRIRVNPTCFHPFQIWPISDFLKNL